MDTIRLAFSGTSASPPQSGWVSTAEMPNLLSLFTALCYSGNWRLDRQTTSQTSQTKLNIHHWERKVPGDWRLDPRATYHAGPLLTAICRQLMVIRPSPLWLFICLYSLQCVFLPILDGGSESFCLHLSALSEYPFTGTSNCLFFVHDG